VPSSAHDHVYLTLFTSREARSPAVCNRHICILAILSAILLCAGKHQHHATANRCVYLVLPLRPHAANRSAATTRTYLRYSIIVRRHQQPEHPRNTALCTPLTTPNLASAIHSAFSPPLSLHSSLLHLADQRHSNLASSKPRRPLTRGKPRV
jgi:hypothetical protein